MLRTYLEEHGFRVSEAANGRQLRQRLQDSAIDLILLDVMLPGEDGLTLGRQIRQYTRTPLIFLTARGDVIDRVAGLEIGADDYLSKPFHLREVLARIRAVMRRSELGAPTWHESREDAGLLRFDDFLLNLKRRELRRTSGELVPLTSGEYVLLNALVQRANRVLSRDQLMSLTKGEAWQAWDRSIDQQIARLRRKIEAAPKSPTLIKTVRNEGYVLACNVEAG